MHGEEDVSQQHSYQLAAADVWFFNFRNSFVAQVANIFVLFVFDRLPRVRTSFITSLSINGIILAP